MMIYLGIVKEWAGLFLFSLFDWTFWCEGFPGQLQRCVRKADNIGFPEVFKLRWSQLFLHILFGPF